MNASVLSSFLQKATSRNIRIYVYQAVRDFILFVTFGNNIFRRNSGIKIYFEIVEKLRCSYKFQPETFFLD